MHIYTTQTTEDENPEQTLRTYTDKMDKPKGAVFSAKKRNKRK